MAAEDPTTWGEVCKNVGMADNLYRTCREKVPDWMPNGAFDAYEPEEEADFSRSIKKTALAIPPPPSTKDIEDSEPGFFEELMSNKTVLYGGIAGITVLLFLLLRRYASTDATAAPAQRPQQPAPQKSVTSQKAA